MIDKFIKLKLYFFWHKITQKKTKYNKHVLTKNINKSETIKNI